MGNKIDNEENIIINNINNIEDIRINIICPKCPFMPIINITETKERTLICEYRCPSFHMGLVRIEKMISGYNNANKNHGLFCGKCSTKNNKTNHPFKFCGVCKSYLCNSCIMQHKKRYSNHPTLENPEINSTCVYHRYKYKFYCFTCLRSLCTKCIGHKNHSFKELKDFEPNEDFFENLNFYFEEVYDYFNSIKQSKIDYNKEYFKVFKQRNILLLNFIKDLYKQYLERKKNDLLNGEIIINLLNLSIFNLDTKSFYKNENNYLQTHLILRNNSLASICAFSNIKANYKIGNLYPVFFKNLNIDHLNDNDNDNNNNNQSMTVKRMDYDFIAYNIEKGLYFMKDEEKIYFKVDIEDNINNFFQLKEHIIAICSINNIFFYKIMKIQPYLVPISISKPTKIKNIVQIYGNIYQNSYIIDIHANLYNLFLNKKKPLKNGFIPLEIKSNINLNNEKTKNDIDINIDNNKNIHKGDIIYKLIMYEKTKNEVKRNNDKINLKNFKYLIKGIVNNKLIIQEKNMITIRNGDILNIENKREINSGYFIVYNSHILVSEWNEIFFYSIPDFFLVSVIQVTCVIKSFFIPNKNMFLIIGKNYIEQLELNTWKKISTLYIGDLIEFSNKKENEDEDKNEDKKENEDEDENEDITIIGNNKELYMFKNMEIFKFENKQ